MKKIALFLKLSDRNSALARDHAADQYSVTELIQAFDARDLTVSRVIKKDAKNV
jgi:hypothetical protein